LTLPARTLPLLFSAAQARSRLSRQRRWAGPPGVAGVLLFEGSDVDLEEIGVDTAALIVLDSAEEYAFPTFVPEGNHSDVTALTV